MRYWFPLTEAAHTTMQNPEPEHRRASGLCVCICGDLYRNHPLHPLVLNYEGEPFDQVLCDGSFVHL